MEMDQRHPATIAERPRSWFRLRLAVACALLGAACSPQEGTTGATDGQPVEEPPLQYAMSALDVDPGFSAVGGWWYVANSTLVVRGILEGIQETFDRGETEFEVWTLVVSEVLLGEASSPEVRVAQYSRDRVEAGWHFMQVPWHEGQEGIFFLTPHFGAEGVVPDLYASVHGSLSVIGDDLDHWAAHLPKASEALGLMTHPERQDLTPFFHANRAELVVEGVIEHMSTTRQILGWELVEVTLPITTFVWTQTASLEDAGETLEYEPTFTIVLDAGVAQNLQSGDRIRVTLELVALPDPVGPVWVPVGGAQGLLDLSRSPSDVSEEIESLRAQRETLGPELVTAALGVLTSLSTEHGQVPINRDESPGQDREPVDLTDLYNAPLVIEQEAVVIIFDKWFFALLDGTGQVTITDRAGNVIAEGPVEGSEAITQELPDGSINFLDSSGRIVANLTQEEWSDAALAALDLFEQQAGR